MLAAETVPPGHRLSPDRHIRRRSLRDRVARNFRRAWRRTRLRRAIVSLLLALGAVWAGYKASMYVANQSAPSPEEVGVIGRYQ
jgi:hypothetical protein